MIINNVTNETLKLLVYPTKNDKIKWEKQRNVYETEYQGMKFGIWKDGWMRIFRVDDLRMHNFDNSLARVLYKAVKQNEVRTRAQAAKQEVVKKEKKLREKALPKLQALQEQETLNRSEEKNDPRRPQ